jgi:hypothetical protein
MEIIATGGNALKSPILPMLAAGQQPGAQIPPSGLQ